MADIKVSALPTTASVSSADIIPIVQGGVTKRALISQIPGLNSDATAATTSLDTTASGLSTSTVQGGIDNLRKSVLLTDIIASQNGASNLGVLDCTAALNVLGSASRTWPARLVFEAGDYLISDTVTFSSAKLAIYISPGARIIYSGPIDRPAIVFGVASATTNLPFICEGEIRTSGNNWTGDNFAALRIIRVKQQLIKVSKITGFTTGLDLYGSSTQGIEFNDINIGTVFDAKYACRFYVAVDQGYINGNTFSAFGAQITSGYPLASNAYGLYYTGGGGVTNRSVNQNHLINPSYQLGASFNPGVQRIPIYHDDCGGLNTQTGGRSEGGGGDACVVCVGTTQEVNSNHYDFAVISNGEFDVTLSQTGSATDNLVINRNYTSTFKSVWHSGPLLERAWAAGAGAISVRGMFLQNTSTSTESWNDTWRIGYQSLLSGTNRALGVWVDTEYYKNFEVLWQTVAGFPGRIRVACYDATDTLMDGGTSGAPHVHSGSSFAGAANYGYSYSTSSDVGNNLKFCVNNPNVAKIKIMFNSGTVRCYLKSFSITGFTTEPNAKGLHVYAGRLANFDMDMSPATPATSTYGGPYSLAGKIVRNSAPSSAAVAFWYQSAPGWNAKAWLASTAYIVDDLVTNDTGKTYRCLTAGTSAGSGGPTGTATSAITDNTAVWGYIGTQATWAAGNTLP